MACWTRGRPVGPEGGEIGEFGQFADVDILFNFSLKNFSREIGGHFEMAELFETFATLRLMLAGPVGGGWTCGWPYGLDLDRWVARLTISIRNS